MKLHLLKIIRCVAVTAILLVGLQFAAQNARAASWHSWTQILAPGGISNPECALWGQRISCWYLDSGDKSVIWLASMDSDWSGSLSWFGAVNLEGNIATALSCAVQNTRLMNCFGVGSDQRLYENVYREQGPIVWWTEWTALGGKLAFAPSCVLRGASGIECFASGTNKDLYQFSFDGLIWKAPRNLAGTSTVQPSCNKLNGGINCFVVNGRGNVQWRRFTQKWSSWKNIGGNVSAAPECVSLSGGLRCFARGRDGILKEASFHGGQWSWQSLGVKTATAPRCLKPTATSITIECFLVSDAGTLIRSRFNGIFWDPPQDLGGQIKGRPACVAANPNRIDCIARSRSSGTPQHIAYY